MNNKEQQSLPEDSNEEESQIDNDWEKDAISLRIDVFVVAILLFVGIIAGIFLWKAKEESITGNDISGTILNETTTESSVNDEPLIVFRVEDMKTVETKDEFSIEDYFIKNKVSGTNHYYIDENQVLWGYGYNKYGQMGIGKVDDLETFYTDPVK
ncbi:MAG TPA: hypothetical protein VJY54_03645 [Lachnospiraceae bacterium]|nr:hypothetical protein [Lachnospiraceae bacterium]